LTIFVVRKKQENDRIIKTRFLQGTDAGSSFVVGHKTPLGLRASRYSHEASLAPIDKTDQSVCASRKKSMPSHELIVNTFFQYMKIICGC
jgi:hypothetical protein